uniref:Uncharacterized protein n=1 Tax=Romanomermis culicivorax TaxID=13658 RepID=A0A915KK51_ROMCU
MDEDCLITNTLVCHIYNISALPAAASVNVNGVEDTVMNG